MNIMHMSIICAALALSAAAAPPQAAPAEPEGPAPEISAAAPMSEPEAERPRLLGPDELEGQRGGATFIFNNQNLLGIISGNVVNGDFTAGTVALSDHALSNFNGILSMAINTGLQSNIISGMAVTITVRD